MLGLHGWLRVIHTAAAGVCTVSVAAPGGASGTPGGHGASKL